MDSGIKAGATVANDSVIRTKDGSYRNERWCLSGLKMGATVASVGAIRTKDTVTVT